MIQLRYNIKGINMDIKTVLNEYTKKAIPTKNESTIFTSPNKDLPFLVGSKRELISMVSMIGWTTHTDGTQDFFYLSMNRSLNFYTTTKFLDGYENTEHTHSYIELCYVANGSLTISISGQQHLIKKGDFFLISSNAPHHEIMRYDNSTIVYLALDDMFLAESDESSDYTKTLKKFINRKRSEYSYMLFHHSGNSLTETENTLALITKELIDNLTERKDMIICLTMRLINLLLMEYRADIQKSDRDEMQETLIASICSYIDSNISTVTVDDIHHYFHYSSDYLTRLFKAKFGSSLSSTIQDKRLIKAHELLISTNMTVEDISIEVGYNNIGFFYSKFKAKYHCTPKAVRKQD